MSNTEQLVKKLDELYSNKKSKNFVLHLVRSYLPVNKPRKVFTKPEKMGNFKCALSGASLISVDEIFKLMKTEEYEESFMNDLKFKAGLMLEGGSLPKDYVNPLEKMTEGKILGFHGEETSTYMSQPAITALLEWTINKTLSGDSKVNWTMRQMTSKTDDNKFKSFFDDINIPNSNKIRKNKSQSKPKRASTKLGDLEVLSKLKAKMEKEEK